MAGAGRLRPPWICSTDPLVHSTDTNPGVALLNVGTGRLDWHPVLTDFPAWTGHSSRADVRPPPWIARLPKTAVPQEHTTNAVTLRFAAVLVLLSDGDNGVTALLTTRASKGNVFIPSPRGNDS